MEISLGPRSKDLVFQHSATFIDHLLCVVHKDEQDLVPEAFSLLALTHCNQKLKRSSLFFFEALLPNIK